MSRPKARQVCSDNVAVGCRYSGRLKPAIKFLTPEVIKIFKHEPNTRPWPCEFTIRSGVFRSVVVIVSLGDNF